MERNKILRILIEYIIGIIINRLKYYIVLKIVKYYINWYWEKYIRKYLR